MPAGPTDATDIVRHADLARLPEPARFTPEEEAIDLPDDDDDPTDPLTPGDLWF
ncbi:MAG TPA: hypothetical protein VFI22_01600 [Thermomicrobiales bacterium]|nr:hypothetical protein [Thermomicrobiales bacterium]